MSNKKNILSINIFSLLLLFNVCTLVGQGLRADGKKIVDKNGNEVLLRGMGLGGWMLQEGYMMQSAGIEGAGTQFGFRNKITELIGEDKTAEFYDAWLENYVSKTDIDSLASWGFNSVRVPLHYNLFTLPIEQEPISGTQTWLTKGFEMLDELLVWCEANQMYLILDLHAAPGGQGKNADISDYDETKPSLWESEDNKTKTVALWRKLAERYRDKEWIGGYDLLNETNWPMDNNNPLRDLSIRITNAIREVDTNHIIYIEGNGFANDFTNMTPPWDDNLVYSFHKYWSYNDQGSIQWVLDLRNQYNVPLWCGESGENSNVWFRDAIRLFEDNNIGWSWWPVKRLETIVSPFSAPINSGYRSILNYWKGEGSRPSETAAYNALMQLAENTLASNNSYHKDVVDAMFRQVYSDKTLPFAAHTIPGVIHMSDFDLGTLNHAYYDTGAANYDLSTGAYVAWNTGWAYRNDGVDLQPNTDVSYSNGYHISHTEKGEWMKYTVTVEETGVYQVKARVATSSSGGKFHLSLDGNDITSKEYVSNTGGFASFANKTIHGVFLEEGVRELTFHIDGEIAFNISRLQFVKTGDASTIPFKLMNAYAGTDEQSIELIFNQGLAIESLSENSKEDFQVKINGLLATVVSLISNSENPKSLSIALSSPLLYTDEIEVSYSGEGLTSQTDKPLDSFVNFTATNNLPKRNIIPGKIEAENYTEMEGLSTEECTDLGGGLNISYTDNGDSADYPIFVRKSGEYKVSARIASAWDSGRIGIYLVENNSTTFLKSINTTVTGDWQQWETVSTSLTLESGLHLLRFRVLSSGFNLNWLDFEFLDDDGDGIPNSEDQCPNTSAGAEVDLVGCDLFAVAPSNYRIAVKDATCNGSNNGSISIEFSDKSFPYRVQLGNGALLSHTPESSANMLFENLSPDLYTACISIEGIAGYKTCFDLQVQEPSAFIARSQMGTKDNSISLYLSGADRYVIEINERTYTTDQNFFNTQLSGGLNTVKVSTDLQCQGTYYEEIEVSEAVVFNPNPFENKAQLFVPGTDKKRTLVIYNMVGKLVFQKELSLEGNRNAMLDLKDLAKGVYLAVIKGASGRQTFKIIKQ